MCRLQSAEVAVIIDDGRQRQRCAEAGFRVTFNLSRAAKLKTFKSAVPFAQGAAFLHGAGHLLGHLVAASTQERFEVFPQDQDTTTDLARRDVAIIDTTIDR
jgi:hypothetical protein